MLTEYLFYFFAGLTVLSAFYIVLTANVLHAALGLLGTLLGVAALYVFAGADFLGVTQILIYAGGILVLIMMGVMLSTRNPDTMHVVSGVRGKWVGYLIAGGLFTIMLICVLAVNLYVLGRVSPDMVVKESTISAIGVGLMTTYILPFELAAVILLVALIGAAHIAGHRQRKEEKQ